MVSYIKKLIPHSYKSHIRASWAMSWPMVFIMLFEFFINLTDVYIAGLLGKEFQATVGFIAQVYFIFSITANAITMGTVAVVSKLFTANNTEKLCNSVYSITITACASGLILSFVGYFIAPSVINILHIPQSVKLYGLPLIKAYAFGLVFHYFLINTNGILRATKSVQKSMWSMAVVCVSNVLLNFYLVFNTSLGYKGIAYSTVCSFILGALCNAYFIRSFLKKKAKLLQDVIKQVFSIGWPTGILQVSWQTGSAVLFIIIGLLPELPVETLAAFTNGLRIESAIFMPAFAFSLSNAAIVGNLLGEKRYEDAFKTGIVTSSIGVVIITFLTALVILNAEFLSSLLSNNSFVIDECKRYLYISMISEPFMAWAVITGGALNGAGDTKSVLKIVSLTLWIVRLPLSYFLGIYTGLGAPAIWWSMNTSIFIHLIFITRRYFKRKWLIDEKGIA